MFTSDKHRLTSYTEKTRTLQPEVKGMKGEGWLRSKSALDLHQIAGSEALREERWPHWHQNHIRLTPD